MAPKLRSLGFKLATSQNEVWVGVLKIPAKICIFEAIFQLSAEHSIFHLEFISVVAVVQTLFIILLKIWDVARKKKIQKQNTFQLPLYKN